MKTFESARHLTDLLNAYFAGVDIAANFAPGKQSKTEPAKPNTTPENKSPQKAKSVRKKQVQPNSGHPHQKPGNTSPGNTPPATGNTPLKPDPPTLSGLALFLGFDSIAGFDAYEATGQYKTHLKRARLLITAAYEKKLHNSYTSGPIFALKALGWNNEKPDDKKTPQTQTILNMNVVTSGPQPASTESEVQL